MSVTKMNMDEYARKLLYCRLFLKNEYRRYYENDYWIEGVEGIISPEMLQQVIVQGRRSRYIRKILIGILWFADKASITDSNFRLLYKFPAKYRNSYFDVLGHIGVSFYQMEIINQHSPSWEAFAWLFDHICKNEFFTEYDMYKLLKESKGVTVAGIKMCIEYSDKLYGWSNKLETARDFMLGME